MQRQVLEQTLQGLQIDISSCPVFHTGCRGRRDNIYHGVTIGEVLVNLNQRMRFDRSPQLHISVRLAGPSSWAVVLCGVACELARYLCV